MDDIRLEIKSVLFFLATTSSIIIFSYLIGVQIEVSLLLIFLCNRIYNRQNGYHSSNLIICYITSTVLFTLFAWFSITIHITPLILLCGIILIDHDRLEQSVSLALAVFIGVAIPEYSWLIPTMFFSIVLAWCTNGTSIVSKILKITDELLIKIIK